MVIQIPCSYHREVYWLIAESDTEADIEYIPKLISAEQSGSLHNKRDEVWNRYILHLIDIYVYTLKVYKLPNARGSAKRERRRRSI